LAIGRIVPTTTLQIFKQKLCLQERGFGTAFLAHAFLSLCSNALCSKAIKKQRRTKMKKLAIGIATAAMLLGAAPAMAQVGFYAGPGGIGVGVGAPGPYYGACGYGYGYDYPCGDGYYDYYGGPNVVIGGGHWHGNGAFRHHR
jgi:hypothetical protein